VVLWAYLSKRGEFHRSAVTVKVSIGLGLVIGSAKDFPICSECMSSSQRV